MTTTAAGDARIYEGEGDQLMQRAGQEDCILLLPDEAASATTPDPTPRIRIMWGHCLLHDALRGRYKSLVCAVNAEDNSHGIIAQFAERLPNCHWTERSITTHASHFVRPETVSVVKYDMDTLEILALLRPRKHDHLTLDDLGEGFKILSEMLRRRPRRLPCASVCFLGARANRLVEDEGGEPGEPTFETVLRTMYQAGYRGDVYPATWMWDAAPTGVFARYPFPESLHADTGGST